MHGSLMYRDKRLAGYDAATVVEVIAIAADYGTDVVGRVDEGNL